MTSTKLANGPRCSTWMKDEGVDPIGTAGSYAGYLLVEWPLPWPRDLSELPALVPVLAALEGTAIRLQGLVPTSADEEARRVIRYSPVPGEGFGGYQRTECIVTPERVVSVAVELARGSDGDAEGAQAAVAADVLVCTHGSRDVCCGSQGTALVMELSADPARFADSVRLWRTSHTGGHRFAPTTIVLPQGTAWSFMDADALGRITHRQGPLDGLLSRYRGSTGMASRAIQAVEREAFGEVGWEWLDWRRWGEELGDGIVQVTGRSPEGERRRWTAHVEVIRQVPVPECGLPIEEAKKSEPELAVTDLRRGDSASTSQQ